MAGKGSGRRPRFVPLAELAARWDATFGKRETTPDAPLNQWVPPAFPGGFQTHETDIVALQYNATFPPGRLHEAYASTPTAPARTPLPSTTDGEA